MTKYGRAPVHLRTVDRWDVAVCGASYVHARAMREQYRHTGERGKVTCRACKAKDGG